MISQYFPCNSCSSPNSTLSRIWAPALVVASFSCIPRHCASFPTGWHFSKKASGAYSSISFTFPSILSDLELAELFSFELLLEDLLEWLFVFDEAVEDLSSFVSFHQECTFFLNLRTLSSTSSGHSSLLLICSSSRYCLHSWCATKFRMSLNCANFSSIATLAYSCLNKAVLQWHHFSSEV